MEEAFGAVCPGCMLRAGLFAIEINPVSKHPNTAVPEPVGPFCLQRRRAIGEDQPASDNKDSL
jgi:hypothetical protein